jgi:hypothetical protein
MRWLDIDFLFVDKKLDFDFVIWFCATANVGRLVFCCCMMVRGNLGWLFRTVEISIWCGICRSGQTNTCIAHGYHGLFFVLLFRFVVFIQKHTNQIGRHDFILIFSLVNIGRRIVQKKIGRLIKKKRLL